jgi:cytoskeletal protein CcmA (bactofilin family)
MSFFNTRRQSESAPTNQPAPQKLQAPREIAPTSAAPQVGFETVLGANSALEGILKSGANVRLDGSFTGTLEISGNVLVGETAKINADVNAKNISIAGAVRGNVSGKKVQILRTGRVWGDIRATALTTEEGAFLDGKITMVSNEPMNPPNFDTLFGHDGERDDSHAATDSDPIITESHLPIGMGATEDEPEPLSDSDIDKTPSSRAAHYGEDLQNTSSDDTSQETEGEEAPNE